MAHAKKKRQQKQRKEIQDTDELRQRKRVEFEREGASGSRRVLIIGAAVAFAIVAVIGLSLAGSSTSPTAPERIAVAGPQDYSKSNTAMTAVRAEVANGEVTVPLAELKRKRLLYFKYSQGGKEVPLMAMLTPSGRLFTASSMCEPCRSDKFHIEADQTLTCDACGTKWDLETLQGISGGCPNYPPQELKGSVRGDKIVINESDVRSWQPRTV